MFGIGSAVSQSLLNLGSTGLVLWAALWGLTLVGVKRRKSKPDFEPSTQSRPDSRVFACGLIWVLWLVVRSLFSDWSWGSLGDLPILLIPFLAAVIPLPKAKARQSVLRLTFVALLVAIVWGCVQVWVRGESAATAFFRNPIYLSYSLLPAFVFWGSRTLDSEDLFNKSKLSRIAMFGLWVGIGVLLLLTNSRMALMCAGLFVLFQLPKLWVWLGARAFVVCSIFVLGVVGFELLARGHLLQRFLSALNVEDLSTQGRAMVWAYNWDIIVKNFWFGVGWKQNGLSPETSVEYLKVWLPNVKIYAHSIYLQMWAESGLIGLLMFVAAFGALAWRVPQTRWLLAVFAVSGVTENTLSNSKPLHAWVFYLFLAVWYHRVPSRSMDRAE